MRTIYKLGGVAACLTVITVFAEIAVTFLPGGSEVAGTVIEWYMQLQNNWFMGLRNLGLLNIIIVSLGIPLYFALYVAHSKVDKEIAALALIISLMSTAVFYATNRAFSMLELSHLYSLAGSESQRTIIEAAGQAMLSVGRSHSPGTFIGFSFGEIAGMLMSWVMLRNKIFGTKTAFIGMLGFAFLFLFEVWTLFTFTISEAAMVFAFLGGILNLIWLILVGVRFFKLAGSES